MVAIDFPKRRSAATRRCGNKDRRSCLRRSRPSVAQFNGDRRQATEKATLPLLEGPSEPRTVCCDSIHTGYDNVDRLTYVTRPDPDGSGSLAAPVWQFAFNVAGLMTSKTDPLGAVTTYGFDNAQRQTTVTGADPD